MRILFRILKTELKILFYSPIAWLILIVFSFLVGMEFYNGISEEIKQQALGYRPYNTSVALLSGYRGIMSVLLETLYLYIPLLTMGLISREMSSGSIKLAYSSPISNHQIVFGKFLSTIVYCLILVGIILLPILFSSMVIENFNTWAIVAAVIGLFLTISSYAAVGLFMSSITKYQVVAVISTIAVLSSLRYVGGLGQEIFFVRDITTWLSMQSHTNTFLYGMISSKSVLYFIIIIAMFLGFTLVRLRGERKKSNFAHKAAGYAGVFIVAVLVGYVSTIPSLVAYYDGTQTKTNTLTPQSQEIMDDLDGGLTITSYVNVLSPNYFKGMPNNYTYDKYMFEKYIRFKPEIKLKYVYYYAPAKNESFEQRYPNMTPEQMKNAHCDFEGHNPNMFKPLSEIDPTVNYEHEQFRFFRVIERESGERAYLRIFNDMIVDPTETEISVALKTLVDDAPIVGFVKGNGERSATDFGDRHYAAFANDITFRYSLINQGFAVEEVSLETPISNNIDIIVIADSKSEYSPVQLKNYNDFLNRGGNMIILGECRRQDIMNTIVEPLGVEFMNGMLVQPTKEYSADIVPSNVLSSSLDSTQSYRRLVDRELKVVTPNGVALNYATDKGFKVEEILKTDSTGVWIDYDNVDLLNEQPILDSDEKEQAYATMLYLTRKVENKEQRIFVIGDADCISSSEVSKDRAGIDASNFTLIPEMFRKLSYGEYPINTARPRPIDDKINLTPDASKWIMIFFMILIPASFLVGSTVLLIKRKRQ